MWAAYATPAAGPAVSRPGTEPLQCRPSAGPRSFGEHARKRDQQELFVFGTSTSGNMRDISFDSGIGELHHLRPLQGIGGDELAQFRSCHRHWHGAHIDKARLGIRVNKDGVDLVI
jgi:hypothetical protein